MRFEESMAFLVAEARPAVLATTCPDGRPHAAPVWIDVDRGVVWFNTGADTVKGRNLARTGIATICVQDDQRPYSFVVVEGTVKPSTTSTSFASGRPVSVDATWGLIEPRSSGRATVSPASCS